MHQIVCARENPPNPVRPTSTRIDTTPRTTLSLGMKIGSPICADVTQQDSSEWIFSRDDERARYVTLRTCCWMSQINATLSGWACRIDKWTSRGASPDLASASGVLKTAATKPGVVQYCAALGGDLWLGESGYPGEQMNKRPRSSPHLHNCH